MGSSAPYIAATPGYAAQVVGRAGPFASALWKVPGVAAIQKPGLQIVPEPPELTLPDEAAMLAIAKRFAPVIYHRMAGTATDHRFDFPTNFDFDGDWVANNNWRHAADPKYKLYSYVYYSVIESREHYFLHYALYHPRDWSTVQKTYTDVLDAIQAKYKDILNGEVRNEVEFNHENDLEGVLVIVDKHAPGGPAPVALETVAHNYLIRAISSSARGMVITSGKEREILRTENGHPILYVESQKHGIHPWKGETSTPEDPIVVYHEGNPIEFSQLGDSKSASYGLVPIYTTIWRHALASPVANLTFATVSDFGDHFCSVPGAQRPACVIGKIGGHFRGDFLRLNSAAAPWEWTDGDDPSLKPGAWFFDPVYILQRHFGLFDLEDPYSYNPYLGIGIHTTTWPQVKVR